MDAIGTRLGHTLDTTYENAQVSFGQDDVLFLFTDGIIEGENSSGKQYGERRFLKSLLKVAKLDTQKMISQILEDAYDYFEEVPPNDDITLVLVKKG
jgi:serine phosphatase RsbU (regulator of sigma subunit)